MSLKDGKKKMSKSDPSDQSRINMTDTADIIQKKIQRARTDSLPFPEDDSELKDRPEVENLINIYSSISGEKKQNIFKEFSGRDFQRI